MSPLISQALSGQELKPAPHKIQGIGANFVPKNLDLSLVDGVEVVTNDEAIDYEEIKKTFSTPEGARGFVEATGIDTFAAAVGNLHGKYPVPKELDLALLQHIRDAIHCQISLLGGSGSPLFYFEEAAKIGVSKININSDMRYTFRKTLEKVLADNPDEYAIVKLMPTVYEAVQDVVEEKINAFGSAGKAVV